MIAKQRTAVLDDSRRLLRRLRRIKWVVCAKEPFVGPSASIYFLDYLVEDDES
jgi:hypothetical protein